MGKVCVACGHVPEEDTDNADCPECGKAGSVQEEGEEAGSSLGGEEEKEKEEE